MYICISIWIYSYLRPSRNIYMFVYKYLYVYTCIYIHIFTHACIYIHIYVYAHKILGLASFLHIINKSDLHGQWNIFIFFLNNLTLSFQPQM